MIHSCWGLSWSLQDIMSRYFLSRCFSRFFYQDIFQGGWFHLQIVFFVCVLSCIIQFLEIADIEFENFCILTSYSYL